MMAEDNKTVSSATLIVLGDDLDPAQVTQVLDLVPSQAWRKGEKKRVTGYDGKTRFYEGVYEWGGWKLWLPEELREIPFPSQLSHWTQLLMERSTEIKGLKNKGFTVELNCSIISQTYCFQVPSALQELFGSLGVDLDITFYSHRRKVAAKRRKPSRSNTALHRTPPPPVPQRF
jgi:hypothetical protein